MIPVLVLAVLVATGLRARASDQECCPCGLADPLAAALIAAEPDRAEEGGMAARAALSCIDDGALVDVLVVYTPAALADLGSVEEIAAQVSLSVALANVTMQRSLVDTRFRLVGLEPVAYVESGNMAIDMLRLGKPNDGFMDEVHPLRDMLGADLVSLRVGAGQYCGIAHIGKFPLDPAKAFSVLQCDGAVAAHEWGHSLGACHAVGDDDGVGVCDVLGGAFPFSHGWRFDAPQGRGGPGQTYRTMMAYLPGSKILVYSNPSVHWLGVPTGDAVEADNATTISLTAPGVSAFRPATFVDCDVDGMDDACAILEGAVADCNGNWIPDACDLASGHSRDLDCDGAPDECATLLVAEPLLMPDLAAGDEAGGAVALCGDLLAVGVPGADGVGEDAGAVVIFTRTPGGWAATGTLHAAVPRVHARFGAALAMRADSSGTLLLVGRAPIDGSAGGADLFRLMDDGWRHESTMEAPSPDDVGFGAVVALDADHAAVGARLALVDGFPGAGAVHVYPHEAGRVVGAPRRLVAPPPIDPDEFGTAVAFMDGLLVVGAPLDDLPELSAGSVFVFAPPERGDESGTWTLVQSLTSPSAEPFGYFGSAIAVHGSRLAVAAPEEHIAPAGDGTVHPFDRVDGALVATQPLVPAGTPAVEQSGAPCATTGSVIVAGMPRDAEAGSGSGAVIAHRALGDHWIPITLRALDAAEEARFGAAIDVGASTDGTRVAIGAPGHDGGGLAIDAGAVYVVELQPIADSDADGIADQCRQRPDLDGDGAVDGDDLAILLTAWGSCSGCAADLNGDGTVDGDDLGALLAAWS